MILLIGASASGKTEISKTLRKKYGIIKAVTHTTRAPREGEIDGVDYYFVLEESFIQLKNKGFFVETTVYNGNHYGCSKNEVADDKVVIVDPNGLENFLALKDDSIVSFYLEASEETRRKRMAQRGDVPMGIDSRIENDKKAFDEKFLKNVDHRIKTDGKSLNALTSEIYKAYVKTLKARGIKNPNIIIQ